MPTEKDTNFQLNRVQALMTKADDAAATPEEAQAFRNKAEELLVAYGIERAQLESHRRDGAPEEIISKKFSFADHTYPLDRISLLHRIALAFNCNGLTFTVKKGTRKMRLGYILYGHTSDVESVEYLFAALTLHMFSEGAKADKPYWVAQVTFLKSFYAAYTQEVFDRLKALAKRLTDEAEPGTALAVVDRSKKVKTFMHASAKVGKAVARTTANVGYEAGARAGQKADLGQARFGGSRAQIGQ